MFKGFSLIELLIVLAITGILAAFAYPSYLHYIVRAHRIEAQTALFDLANRLERNYSETNRYQQEIASDLLTTVWYALSITQATDSYFELQATPIGSQAKNDTLCQSLTLNSQGVKGIGVGPRGAPLGTINQCW